MFVPVCGGRPAIFTLLCFNWGNFYTPQVLYVAICDEGEIMKWIVAEWDNNDISYDINYRARVVYRENK